MLGSVVKVGPAAVSSKSSCSSIARDEEYELATKEGTSVTQPRLHRIHSWLFPTFICASSLVLLLVLACLFVVIASYRLLT